MRYDTVFLDVDGTLLYVDVDLEGYVGDLAPYSANGPLTVGRAAGPVWESMKRHVSEHVRYRTEEDLVRFRRENARQVARTLGVEVSDRVLGEVSERRISFRPYPESERVLRGLRALGLRLYVVSNWDLLLERVLKDLGWARYFRGVIASAAVGVEKPARGIFEEALRVSGSETERERVVHVGNDPVADVGGAVGAGLDAILIDRGGVVEAPQATAVLPDLAGLPSLLGGRRV